MSGDASPSGAAAPLEQRREALSRNLARVRSRIERAGGDPDAIRIVGVTKTFPVEAALAGVLEGITDLGENYADELLDKAAALEELAPGRARWHFLGSVQRNKLGRLAPAVACYDSVDRLEEGAAIARRSPGAAVLVEVDTARMPGRGGVPVGEVAPLVAALRLLDLRVEGLMTVAPREPSAAREAFSLLGSLRRDLGLAELSMGMTEDLELAVAAGSTMVRLGRALFGPRELPESVSQ